MVGLTVATIALGLGFAVVQRQVAEPLVEPALLRSPAFLVATIGSAVVGLGIVAMASNAAGLCSKGWAPPSARRPCRCWSGR